MNIPRFAIYQNDKTRASMIWVDDKWTEIPENEYEVLAVITKLLRTCPNPDEILIEIAQQNNWGSP